MKFNLYVFIGIIIPTTFGQEKFNIAESINKFSVELLAGVNNEGGDHLNIALSSLTLWTLLTVISEGAYGSTADQIERVLGQPQNKNIVRDAYERYAKTLYQTRSKEAEFETSTGIFTRLEFPIKDKFSRIVNQYYDATVTPVDFKKDNQASADAINDYVARATKNRIPFLVSPADVRDAYLFVTNTMYFKGQWETPFNKSATQRDAFLDDKKNQKGYVQMMYQAHPFPYARIDKIKAHAVELPYGFDNTFSMLVLVPRGAQTATNMINALTRESVTEILERLQRSHERFPEDDIHVYLPKFKITSDFNMDIVLEKLGIRDVFSPHKADLLGIFDHYLFLSRVIQKAQIEVDEEGTVATAAAGSIFLNRSPPPIVKANRPFVFFIIHKKTGSIIFSGKLSNPDTLQ